MCVSQRNVGVFLPGVDLLLAGQHLQIVADLLASGRRLDDVVHETLKTNGCSERGVLDAFIHKDESLEGETVFTYLPLTAAGNGLANLSTYSASASAWFSFPLKII